VDGLLGEDGYYQATRLLRGGQERQGLTFLAFSQASLARYRPATAGGCGVPLTMQLTTTVRWQ
jgi:hypothetical protein